MDRRLADHLMTSVVDFIKRKGTLDVRIRYSRLFREVELILALPSAYS